MEKAINTITGNKIGFFTGAGIGLLVAVKVVKTTKTYEKVILSVICAIVGAGIQSEFKNGNKNPVILKQ